MYVSENNHKKRGTYPFPEKQSKDNAASVYWNQQKAVQPKADYWDQERGPQDRRIFQKDPGAERQTFGWERWSGGLPAMSLVGSKDHPGIFPVKSEHLPAKPLWWNIGGKEPAYRPPNRWWVDKAQAAGHGIRDYFSAARSAIGIGRILHDARAAAREFNTWGTVNRGGRAWDYFGFGQRSETHPDTPYSYRRRRWIPRH